MAVLEYTTPTDVREPYRPPQPDAGLLADCHTFAEHEARQEDACSPWMELMPNDLAYPAAEKVANAWYDERDAIMRRLGKAVLARGKAGRPGPTRSSTASSRLNACPTS